MKTIRRKHMRKSSRSWIKQKFLDIIPKAQSTQEWKYDRVDYIQIIFTLQSHHWKNEVTNLEIIFANHISDTGIYPKNIKNTLQLSKNTKNLNSKMGKGFEQKLTQWRYMNGK